MLRLFLKIFGCRSMERDLETELAFHRDMAAAHGNPIPMGNATVVQEQARDLWRFTFVENLWPMSRMARAACAAAPRGRLSGGMMPRIHALPVPAG